MRSNILSGFLRKQEKARGGRGKGVYKNHGTSQKAASSGPAGDQPFPHDESQSKNCSFRVIK
jgi:hypothetical protein